PISVVPSLVGVGDAARPGELWLGAIVPNPALNGIAVSYTLPRAAVVSLSAFDIAGRKLADLAQGMMPAGDHRATWDFRDAGGREVAAGYYVLKLRVGDRVLM